MDLLEILNLKQMPDRHLGVLGTPDVTVCILLSLLFQMTVLPTFIFTWFGENALLPWWLLQLHLILVLHY